MNKEVQLQPMHRNKIRYKTLLDRVGQLTGVSNADIISGQGGEPGVQARKLVWHSLIHRFGMVPIEVASKFSIDRQHVRAGVQEIDTAIAAGDSLINAHVTQLKDI